MKKILLTVLVLVLWLVSSGMYMPTIDECYTYECNPYYTNPRTHTHGDWEVIYESKTTCKIYDLSEQGKKLDVVIIPTEIAGRKVVGFHTYYSNSHSYVRSISFSNQRVYFTDYVPFDSTVFKRHEGVWVFILFAEEIDDPVFSQYNKSYHSNVVPLFVKRPLTDFSEGQIVTWNEEILPASVSYYYNYEGSPNQGYYWLDDGYFDAVIKYRPKNPTREGYEFTGWYKEPECVNEWDFDKDIVVSRHSEPEGGYNLYYETALYAGWRKI